MGDVFCNESIRFLLQNSLKNSREWYANNRKSYEEFLLTPFRRLVGQLSTTMIKIDPNIEVRPLVGKTISRIHRDTRFSKDKSLYHDKMWITFAHRTKESKSYPGFFFEVSPSSYRYGMGFFCASVKTMDLYRDAIIKNEEEFVRLVTDIKNKGYFVPEGEMYKRSKYKGSNELISHWYDRKSIYLVDKRDDIEEIFDFDSLQENISIKFYSLEKFYHFLKNTVSTNVVF